MSERLKADLALWTAAVLAAVMVLGANLSLAEVVSALLR